MDKKQEIILSSFRDGESISAISKQLKICRKTVRKYLNQYKLKKEQIPGNDHVLIEDIVMKPAYDSSTRKKRKLNEEIIQKVQECLTNNRRKMSCGQHKQMMKRIDIFEHLQILGYDISYTTVCNLINELQEKQAEAFIRQNYQPGSCCEFDWGEVKIFIADQLQTFQLAVFTAAYSNYRFALLFPRQDTLCFQEAHTRFFAHLGGVYRTMVYDNMKVAVRKFAGWSEKEPTDGLLQLSMYYNFAFRFCNVRAGNEKGHVERSVEYIRRKAFSIKDRFLTLDEANIYLLDICLKLNNHPPSDAEKQTAQALFEEEKLFLLPDQPKLECAVVRSQRADKYATVIVDNCHYSVPENYTGKMITVKTYPDKIKCFYDEKWICSHRRSLVRGKWIIDLSHYLQTLLKKPGALHDSAALKQADERLQKIYQNYFLHAEKDFLRLLLYIKDKGKRLREIQDIIGQLQQISPADISTDKIILLCERKNSQKETSQPESSIEKYSLNQLLALSCLLPGRESLKSTGGVL